MSNRVGVQSLDVGPPIHGHVREIREESRSHSAIALEFEQLGRLGDEMGVAFAGAEGWMIDDLAQERDVRLDSAYTEFSKRPKRTG